MTYRKLNFTVGGGYGPGAGRMWIVSGVVVKLTTSATAGTRRVQVWTTTDSVNVGNEGQIIADTLDQTGVSTTFYAVGGLSSSALLGNNTQWSGNLHLFSEGGGVMVTATSIAGDTFIVAVSVEEKSS